MRVKEAVRKRETLRNLRRPVWARAPWTHTRPCRLISHSQLRHRSILRCRSRHYRRGGRLFRCRRDDLGHACCSCSYFTLLLPFRFLSGLLVLFFFCLFWRFDGSWSFFFLFTHLVSLFRLHSASIGDLHRAHAPDFPAFGPIPHRTAQTTLTYSHRIVHDTARFL